MNNYITVLIDTLHKTSIKKGHITMSEVTQNQRIPKHNINLFAYDYCGLHQCTVTCHIRISVDFNNK